MSTFKNSRTVWIALALTLALAAAFAPAFAQTEGEPGDAGPGDHLVPIALEAVAHFLHLAPEQTEHLLALLTQREQALAPIKIEVAALEARLEQLVSNGEDPPAIGILVLEIHQRHQAIHAIQAEVLANFEASLAPPQRKRLRLVRRAFEIRDVVPAFARLGLI